jgi:hypothetical protein
VRVSERAFEKLHDLLFARDGIRTVFASQFHRRLLLLRCRGDQIDYGGDMLHLLRECAYTLEFAARRRKVVSVGGHGVRQRHKLALDWPSTGCRKPLQ